MLMTVVPLYTICWLPLNLYLMLSKESISRTMFSTFSSTGWQLAAPATTPTSTASSFQIEVQRAIMEIQKMLLDGISFLRGSITNWVLYPPLPNPAHCTAWGDPNPGVAKFPWLKYFNKLSCLLHFLEVEISFLYSPVPRFEAAQTTIDIHPQNLWDRV